MNSPPFASTKKHMGYTVHKCKILTSTPDDAHLHIAPAMIGFPDYFEKYDAAVWSCKIVLNFDFACVYLTFFYMCHLPYHNHNSYCFLFFFSLQGKILILASRLGYNTILRLCWASKRTSLEPAQGGCKCAINALKKMTLNFYESFQDSNGIV